MKSVQFFRPFQASLLILALLGSGCASAFYKKAESAMNRSDYPRWQNLWDTRKQPFKVSETIVFRRQGQIILNRLLDQKDGAIRNTSVAQAQDVADRLPQVLSGIKTIDQNFINYAPAQNTLKAAEVLAKSSRLLPQLVEAQQAYLAKNWSKAIRLATSCPPENLPSYMLELRENAITVSVHAQAASVRRLGETGSFNQESIELKAFLGMVQANALDIQSMPCPADIGSFTNYKDFFDDSRRKCANALERKARLFLDQKQYEDAKQAAESSLQITNVAADRTRLEALQQSILDKGVADYRTQVNEAVKQQQFDLAIQLLHKIQDIDPTVNVSRDIARCEADKKEKTGQDELKIAKNCYANKDWPCAEAHALIAITNLRDTIEAHKVWVDARENIGREHLKLARDHWARAEFESALRECDLARPYLQNPKQADDLKSTIKDERGRQLLQLARTEIDNDNCKTAIQYAREARPLLFKPGEADLLENQAKACATRRVLVIVQNHARGQYPGSLLENWRGAIQNGLQRRFNEYFIVLQSGGGRQSGDPQQIAEAAGADYAVVITLDDLDYNAVDDPGFTFGACTSTSQTYRPNPYYYTELFTYSQAWITKYVDRAYAGLNIRGYIIDVRRDGHSDDKSQTVENSWSNEFWRSNTNAIYLRECPCGQCQWVNTPQKTNFYSTALFQREKISAPSAIDLLGGGIRLVLVNWSGDFADALNRMY